MAAGPSKGGMSLEEMVYRRRISSVCNTTRATNWLFFCLCSCVGRLPVCAGNSFDCIHPPEIRDTLSSTPIETQQKKAEMARVSAEMVRPIVTPRDLGGYDIQSLRICSLARTILIRLKYPAVARNCVCVCVCVRVF